MNDEEKSFDILQEGYDYVNNLSMETVSKIKLYTDGGMYEKINFKLRSNIELEPEEQSVIDAIDYALDNVPKLKQPLTVYRGVAVEKKNFKLEQGMNIVKSLVSKEGTSKEEDEDEIKYGKLPSERSRSASKGSALPPRSIISASLKKDLSINEFTHVHVGRKDFIYHCCLLQITLPVGSSVLPIDILSEYSEEREVLLSRKGVYYLTGEVKESIDKDEFVYVYYITHIPETSVKV
jgi:hypothetical protein